MVRRKQPAGARRSTIHTLLSACIALCTALLARPVDAQRNNYYTYTDADGVIHITNVRGSKGAWKLYKSLPGSGSEGIRPRSGRGARTDAMPGERMHRYDSLVAAAARRYQLPEALVRAVIHTESNFSPTAVSSAGAMGLMQLMPSTARFLGVGNPFDPRQNVYGGARFLRLLANRYNGDMVLVLAAYNAGAGNVEKYRGVPPFEQTRAYVRAVLRRYYAYERQSQVAGSTRLGPARHIAH